MESLRSNFKDLVKQTLVMESVLDPRLQSQTTKRHQGICWDTDRRRLQGEFDRCASKKSQDFSTNDKKNKVMDCYKVRYTATRIKYSTTSIKSRNFFSTISYTGINKQDFYNESFIIDVYVLLVKKLNPFSMSRKLVDKNKHEMVYMLWRECIPSEFYRHICQGSNFIYLNSKHVSQPGVLDIVANFINQSKQNLCLLQENVAPYKDIFQYVYSHVFPEVYTATEKRGFGLKSNFHVMMFKTYHDKMMIRQQQATAKNIENYKKERQETCEFEQKPIKNFDQFRDREEQQIKERAKKRSTVRREHAKESKVKKLKLKENSKAMEGQMWNRLDELNREFKKIKQTKKETQKISSTIL